jgi:AraC family transcriptional regulator
MEPRIVDKDRMLLLGFSFFGDPFQFSGDWSEENEIGRLWKRFMAYLEKRVAHIHNVSPEHVFYEVHIYHEETISKGLFEIFVGLQVTSLEDVPVDLLVKILPPTRYAVFTLKGQQITSDWHLMIHDWLEAAGYRATGAYSFQYYDQRFKGLDQLDASSLDVYIPLQDGVQETPS